MDPGHRFDDSDDEDNDIIDHLETIIMSGGMPGFKCSVGEHSLYSTITAGEPRQQRRENKPLDFDGALKRFNRLYFDKDSLYSNAEFEKRVRMSRTWFPTSRRRNQRKRPFGLQANATGKCGVCPRIGIISALQVLSYDMKFNQVDE